MRVIRFPASVSQKHELPINNYSGEKIALCKTFGKDTIKIHELHAYHYDWKRDYNFKTYIFGDRELNNNRHQLVNSNSFWNEFNKTYRQAIVEHGRLSLNFKDPIYITTEYDNHLTGEEIKYILSRARGSYTPRCTRGDIDRFMDTVELNANYGENRRVILQLGYPIKRFWPLQARLNGEIDICGSNSMGSENDPKTINSLVLEPLNGKNLRGEDCSAFDAFVTWDNSKGTWMLNYYNGNKLYTQVASTKNVDPECVVFMDTVSRDYKYLEELPLRTAALAKEKGKATVVILPWLGDITLKVALHELGHTIGLTDVNDARLSTRITDEHIEGNLMHSSHTRKGRTLRNRGMVPDDSGDCGNRSGKECIELQWDCLHKKSGACLKPNLDPALR